MNVIFLKPAAQEFSQAIDYYNSQSDGLVFEFALEVRRTLTRIAEYPQAWQSLSPRTRRCRTSRFPYAVIYHLRTEGLLIVAIQNLHQHPDSWQGRRK